MGELSEAAVLLKHNVERIHKATDETNAKILTLTPDVYADGYIAKKTAELRGELQSFVEPIVTELQKKVANARSKYEPANRLRRATMLPAGSDPGAEALARNQKLVELELLDESSFDSEIEDMVREKNLAGLHLATLAVKQRKYKDGFKRTWLDGRIREALALEIQCLNEIEESSHDLESALRAVRGTGEDTRRKMKDAVTRYHDSHKGREA